MSVDSKIEFGKYKGKTVMEVWSGKVLNLSKVDIENFVKDSIDFFLGKCVFSEKILSSGANLDKDDVELLEYFFTLKKDNIQNSVSVNSRSINLKSLHRKYRIQFKSLLIKHFNHSYFKDAHFLALKHPENEDLAEISFTTASQRIVDTLPDPSYIKWGMDNDISLPITQSQFDELKNMYSLFPAIILNESSEDILSYTFYTYILKHNLES